MPRTTSTRKPHSTSRSKRASTPAKRGSRSKSTPLVPVLSAERKKDIVGILIAAVGLLALLSFFSTAQGTVTTWLADALRNIAGWGAAILALAMLAGGLALVLRNLDKLPTISAGRAAGVVLLFLNLLAWFAFFDPLKTMFGQGSGGGYLGAAFSWLLVEGLGRPGAGFALGAWALVSLLFILDLSLPEMLGKISAAFGKIPRPKSSTKSVTRRISQVPTRRAVPSDEPLPDGFNPINLNEMSEIASAAATLPRRTERPVQRPAASASVQQAAAIGAPGSLPVESARVIKAPSKPWTMPALESVLDPATPATVQTHYDKERAQIIEETLASFGAPAHVVEIHRGPSVTQFGVEPDFVESRTGRTRVRVSKIVNLSDDLALALAAPRIRIQAPVPGRSYVGIEVPNTEISRVSLREVIESETFRKIKSNLKFALGKDVAGKPICADLANMPHLLIAGTTNSGKSVCVNSILTCFLLNNSPDDLRLVLVDPKRVELTGYNGIPHLLAPVVVDAERVVGALQWMLREMDARYRRFAQVGARNIIEYNKRGEEHLPNLVVVIDELADLMMLAPEETERSITRLAQLARATGIHLIIATQRPSVDVVTGLIKANFPARVAFAVASGVDSRVILDQPGAEKLLGKGDMLFQAPDASAPVRLQGTYVADGEIMRLVDTWKVIAMNADGVGGSTEVLQMDTSLPVGVPLKQGALFGDGSESGDPMFKEAVELVRREGRASISMLQRRLRVGYTRAARLIDSMEDQGIIGPQVIGSQVREVLDYGQTAPPEEE